MNLFERIIAARAGGAVERCHGIPHATSYSNAKHQWGVAMLLMQLFPADFPRLVSYALTHDVPEAWVGDIPSPTLTHNPEFRASINRLESHIFNRLHLPDLHALNAQDMKIIKSCDALELWIWCNEQLVIGNYFAEDVKTELETYFGPNGENLLPPACKFYLQGKTDLRKFIARQAGVMREVSDVAE